jgi:hypothetical protein
MAGTFLPWLGAWILANQVEPMRLPQGAGPTLLRGPIATNGLRRLLRGTNPAEEER